MPPNEARTQWCVEARRILTLAKSERATPEKALEKSLLAQHAQLSEKLDALRGMAKAEPTLLEKAALDELAHDLQIARSQINVESYSLAADEQLVIGDMLNALAESTKAKAKLAVENASKASNDKRTELKSALSATLAEANGAAPGKAALATLRKLADDEFKRDAEQAALLKQAGTLELGLAPPPARTGFTENTTAAAAVWTPAVCEAAFKAHSWFDFKAFRKQGNKAKFKVAGLDAANCVVSDDVMWRLYQFRRHVVDDLVSQLHARYPGKLLFSSNGSEDIESDLDITVASPQSGVDVEAMSFFNTSIKGRFGRPPGRVFDTNLYARDYNAIKSDNLSKKDVQAAAADHAIAEPGGAMQKMANIDQDVATLMKQRRFMDADAFTKMWKGLRDSMPAPDRKAIEQSFEEAESAYLITAMAKVDAIEKKVQAAVENFDGPAYAEQYGDDAAARKFQTHEDFKGLMAEVNKARSEHAAAKGGNQTKALENYQRLQDKFLDFMEANFEDETMDATDEIYAQRMAELRADQIFIQQQEKALAESTPSARALADMQTALASAKARAKQAQFTNIIFANEAYVSQGAITHVVSGKQAGDASVLARIQPAELMQSSNEQLADFLKDMKHLEHEVPAGDVGDDKGATKRRATGEAFVHASKYLARMLEAVAMLEGKYTNQLHGQGEDAERQLAALKAPYPLVTQAATSDGAINSPKALQLAVEGHLLKLRKSSTIPSDVKAEMALAESMALFDAADIPSLRAKIQAFCTEFNKRVRSLDDFRASQAVDDTTFRQYFDPAAQPKPATV
jgi:hypothetical protein